MNNCAHGVPTCAPCTKEWSEDTQLVVKERDEALYEVERLKRDLANAQGLLQRKFGSDVDALLQLERVETERDEAQVSQLALLHIVRDLEQQLRTVAERQREADKAACFRPKYAITGGPHSLAGAFNAGCDAAAQKVGCAPLVEVTP